MPPSREHDVSDSRIASKAPSINRSETERKMERRAEVEQGQVVREREREMGDYEGLNADPRPL